MEKFIHEYLMNIAKKNQTSVRIELDKVRQLLVEEKSVFTQSPKKLTQ